MTKGEAKKQALRWLDEATLNGQAAGIELTADYTDKFDYFLWNVLVYISAIFKLERSFICEKGLGVKLGGFYKFELKKDFIELQRINVYDENGLSQIYDYIKEGKKTFLIPKRYMEDEKYTVEILYFGMPEEIASDAEDSTELDVQPIAVQLVPLRLAIEATAGSDETNAISAYLEGKFSNMVANLLGDQDGAFNVVVERVYAQ